MPKRIQMSRQHPWRAENPDAVIVDRRTRWGNPYRLDDVENYELREFFGDDGPFGDAELREFVVHYFRLMLECRGWDQIKYPSPTVILADLAGKDLACWCPLEQPCHADVLLELANPSTPGGNA